MCRSITDGRQEDVIEIDAASNIGVEEIRLFAIERPTRRRQRNIKSTLSMKSICFLRVPSVPY